MFQRPQAFDAVTASFSSKCAESTDHVGLGECSHVSKHPRIGPEVQIHGLD